MIRTPGCLILFIAISGCEQQEQLDPDWNGVLPEAAASACAIRNFEGSEFTVCSFDGRKDKLELRWKGKDGSAIRSFERLELELGAKASEVKFAMNGGMYDEAGAPIGLYVEDGERLKKLNLNDGPGNFHLKPNGVFAISHTGQMSVTSSDRFAKKVPDPAWATQSGPMLVIDGKIHPSFDEDGQSQLVRNGVGVSGPRQAHFVISEQGVSFGRFARFFRDELDCPNALFLDGSVSSLWDPATGRRDSYSRLGPMIVVLKHEEPASKLAGT